MEDGMMVARVFGVPSANECGPGHGWRDATEWVARSLAKYFGNQVRVEYVDLFSDPMARFPAVMELVRCGQASPPLIFIGDELLSSGNKISGPAIRQRLESLGVAKKHADDQAQKNRGPMASPKSNLAVHSHEEVTT